MYSDPLDKGAPIYKDGGYGGDGGGVKHLARLTADLSCIPAVELVQRVGKDGGMYCEFCVFLMMGEGWMQGRCGMMLMGVADVIYYEIHMTYYSAETKYALVYKNVKYDSVTAEYV